MTTFVWKKYIEVAEARSQVYGLLSALYMELPDLKWLGGIFDAGFQQSFPSIASDFQMAGIKEGLELIAGFVTEFKSKPREEVFKLVSIDRTRLLHGVGKKTSPPPPYESMYRDGRIWGKSTEEVARTCSHLGIKLSEECSEPPDYIGIEFDLMRLICSAEKEAWEAGSIDKAGKFLQVGSEFLSQHIMRWVPDFCEQMYRKAELDFYRGLSRLTRGFVEYDSRLVEQQIDNIKQKLGWEP